MRRPHLAVVLALAAFEVQAQCPPGSYGSPPPNPPSSPPAAGPAPQPPTRWAPNPTPTTPGPTGPTAPGPSSPQPNTPLTGTPLPPTGPAPAAGRTSGRGLVLEEDQTTWNHWWEFNQDAFLQLHTAVAKLAVTGNDQFYLGATRRREVPADGGVDRTTIVAEVVPALKQALDDSTQRELTTACLLALGRIGVQPPEWNLCNVFAGHVGDSDQTVRETAALALGLAAGKDGRALEMLIGLAHDDATGRKLRGEAVEDRTRAFAIYGIGLAAGTAKDISAKDRILNALSPLLDGTTSSRNVKVAAIHAIGSLDLRGRRYQEVKLADRAVQVLIDYFGKDLGAAERFVQAHVPTALARLVGRDHPRTEECKQLFVAELDRKDGRRLGYAVAQSCALALGQLAAPNDDGDVKANADAAISALLLDVAADHKDAQTRNFATLALGQIGGASNRKALLNLFDRASSSLERPWCALALGVMAYTRGEAGRATTGAFVVDRFVCDTLLDSLKQTKDPMTQGAIAVASGLAGATEAASLLRQRLLGSVSRERLAGELATALALLGDAGAIDDLKRVLGEASQRPELLEHAAIALGRLGEPSVAATLARRLQQSDGNVASVQAAARALAQVGDQRSVPDLLEVLRDTSKSSLQRAGAAEALGGIADPRPLPWNAGYSANTNYRAAAETLTDRLAGVLDLL